MKRKIITVFMLISLSFSSVFYTYASDETISDLQDQIDALEAENAAAQAKQEEARQQLDNYEELLVDIQEQMATIKDQITTKQNEISNLNITIADTQEQIAVLEAEIPEKKQEADSSLVAIQQLTQSNAISSLISGESGDYLKNASSMLILFNSLAQPLKELVDTEKELETQKTNLELDLKNQELAQQELLASQIELENQEDDYNYYIDQQNQIIASSQSGIDDNQAEIEDKQNTIDFYESQGCGPDDVYGVDCGDSTGVEPGTQGFIRPINSDYISTEWEEYSGHRAIDLSGNGDREIYPSYPGKVVSAGWSDAGYGNTILLIHNTSNGTVFTRYSHLSQIYVSAGQTVGYNDQIGYMGETGHAYGVHLDLEVIPDSNGDGYPSGSERVNPRTYIDFPPHYVWWYDRTSAV